MLRNSVANVQLSETLRRTCLAVSHGPVVPVHQSVTDIPHHRPPAPNFSELAVVSCLKIHCRIASSVYMHSTRHLVAYTACVMPSVDSIRRESHAATQDVFQPVLTPKHSSLLHSNSEISYSVIDELCTFHDNFSRTDFSTNSGIIYLT